MFTRISSLLFVISSLLLWAPTSWAASAPLLPPDDTGDLYLLERDCDCVLSISTGGTVTVLVSKSDLITLLGMDPLLEEFTSNNYGLVTTADGTIYFGIGYQDIATQDEQSDFIVKRAAGGTLSILTAPADIIAATGGDEVDLNGLAFGIDGMLYTADNASQSILSIDSATGVISTLVDEAALLALLPEARISLKPGIATDENYVYISSDGEPEALFRVAYNGTPEIFTSGPGADPFDLIPFVVALAVTNGTTGGDFGLELFDGMGTHIVGPINWNASAPDVLAAFDTALPGAVAAVTGTGTELDPWLVEFTSSNPQWSCCIDYLVGGYPYLDVFQESDIVPVQSEIIAIGTDVAPGPADPDHQIDVEIQIAKNPHSPSIYATWYVGDNSATVEAALKADPQVSPGDVTVTGAGSVADPWVLSFAGQLANTRLHIGACCGSTVSVTDGPIFYGRIQSAKAFSDTDVFMTRREDGDLTMSDDKGAQSLYHIDLAGNPTLFKNGWQLLSETGGPVDLEGGLAYDSAGDLFAAIDRDEEYEVSRSRIVRIEPDGTLHNWVSADTVSMATGGLPEDVSFDNAIAFQRISAAAGDRISLDIRTRAIDYELDDVTITGGDLKVTTKRRKVKKVSGDADVPSPVSGTAKVEINIRKRGRRSYRGSIAIDDPAAGVHSSGYFWGRVYKTGDAQAQGQGFYFDSSSWPWQFGRVSFEVTDVPDAPEVVCTEGEEYPGTIHVCDPLNMSPLIEELIDDASNYWAFRWQQATPVGDGTNWPWNTTVEFFDDTGVILGPCVMTRCEDTNLDALSGSGGNKLSCAERSGVNTLHAENMYCTHPDTGLVQTEWKYSGGGSPCSYSKMRKLICN